MPDGLLVTATAGLFTVTVREFCGGPLPLPLPLPVPVPVSSSAVPVSGAGRFWWMTRVADRSPDSDGLNCTDSTQLWPGLSHLSVQPLSAVKSPLFVPPSSMLVMCKAPAPVLLIVTWHCTGVPTLAWPQLSDPAGSSWIPGCSVVILLRSSVVF